MLATRLRQIRQARGLSLEGLAAEMGNIITKQALSKYEHGMAQPTPRVLAALATALNVKAAYLASDPVISVQFVGYRSRANLPLAERTRVQARVAAVLEARVRFQERLGELEPPNLPVIGLPVREIADAEGAADTLRSTWSLGRDPIRNLVGVLERQAVHVIQLDAMPRWDGAAAVAFDSIEGDPLPGPRSGKGVHIVGGAGGGADASAAPGDAAAAGAAAAAAAPGAAAPGPRRRNSTGAVDRPAPWPIVTSQEELEKALSASVTGRPRAAAVALRTGLPADRQRLSIAHELGHLVLNIPRDMDPEAAAYRFGAAFLAPADSVRADVGPRRALVSLDELLLLKRRYGVSVQAMLYRLRTLGIINEAHYRETQIEITKRGWRKAEPAAEPPEQSDWLHIGVLRALSEELVTDEEASELLGSEVHTIRFMDPPEEWPTASAEDRRQFMRLTLTERRRLLAEQAERLSAFYAADDEWRDLEGGDLVE